MEANAILEKSFAFAKRIVNLYKYMSATKKEFVLSKQLLRCGTSIGANVTEAQRGQTKADFRAKMNIALKEAYETEYWLKLLYETEYIEEKAYNSMSQDNEELISLLISICKTAEEK
jgi:four helix bundle protein